MVPSNFYQHPSASAKTILPPMRAPVPRGNNRMPTMTTSPIHSTSAPTPLPPPVQYSRSAIHHVTLSGGMVPPPILMPFHYWMMRLKPSSASFVPPHPVRKYLHRRAYSLLPHLVHILLSFPRKKIQETNKKIMATSFQPCNAPRPYATRATRAPPMTDATPTRPIWHRDLHHLKKRR